MIPTFRLKWMGRCARLGFARKLWCVLDNPFAFYAGIATKLLPGLSTRPIVLRLRGGHGTVIVRSFMTLFIFDEIFIQGVYDDALDAAPATIVDIGANTGLFVLRAKQRCPGARIIAFEPEPENFAALTEMIARNGLRDVTPVRAAIASASGPARLSLHPRNIGGHSTVAACSDTAIDVSAVSLAEALRGGCDLLKMDCEGAEVPLIDALDETLANPLQVIVYETERATVLQTMRKLASLGFAIRVTDTSDMPAPLVLAHRGLFEAASPERGVGVTDLLRRGVAPESA